MSKARDVADSYTDVEVDAKDATVQTQVNDRYTKSESDDRYLQNGDTITSNNGNVGIGTSSPTQPMTVNGDIKSFDSFNTSSNEIACRLSSDNSIDGSMTVPHLDMRRWTGGANDHGCSAIGGYNDGSMRFYTDNKSTNTVATTERMRIDSSGKLLSPNGNAFVGTCSNTGNGAIIERGSNANGEYVKSADGTMICTGSVAFSTSEKQTWTFPTPFINSSWSASGMVHWNDIDTTINISATPQTTSVTVRISQGRSAAVNARLMAIGRWY